jgi:hypothetical protein
VRSLPCPEFVFRIVAALEASKCGSYFVTTAFSPSEDHADGKPPGFGCQLQLEMTTVWIILMTWVCRHFPPSILCHFATKRSVTTCGGTEPEDKSNENDSKGDVACVAGGRSFSVGVGAGGGDEKY